MMDVPRPRVVEKTIEEPKLQTHDKFSVHTSSAAVEMRMDMPRHRTVEKTIEESNVQTDEGFRVKLSFREASLLAILMLKNVHPIVMFLFERLPSVSVGLDISLIT